MEKTKKCLCFIRLISPLSMMCIVGLLCPKPFVSKDEKPVIIGSSLIRWSVVNWYSAPTFSIVKSQNIMLTYTSILPTDERRICLLMKWKSGPVSNLLRKMSAQWPCSHLRPKHERPYDWDRALEHDILDNMWYFGHRDLDMFGSLQR